MKSKVENFKKDFFEQKAWQKNQLVCGIDEAGRGSLAGPVVAASVILFPHKKSSLLKDSKLLDSTSLHTAYRWIVHNSWYASGIMHNHMIDQYNIYNTTLSAMKRSLLQLMATITHTKKTKISTVLIDAMPLDLRKTSYQFLKIYHFPYGEQKSSSIAAASIVAKVTRDRIMQNLDKVFPTYLFETHKGYGTKAHQNAIYKIGSSIIHRKKFLRKLKLFSTQQLNLFFESS